MQLGACTLYFLQYVSRFCAPDKGLRRGIVMLKIVLNRCDEFAYTAKDAAPESLLSQVSEEAFHNVQPRSTGGSKVRMESRVLPHPVLYRRVFIHPDSDS